MNYISFDYNEESSGVKNKIDYQMKSFQNNGFEVKLLKANPKTNSFKRSLEINKKLKFCTKEIFYIRNFGIKLIFYLNLFRNLQKRNNILILEIPTPIKTSKEENKNSKANLLKRTTKNVLIDIVYPKVLKHFDIIVEYGPEGSKYTRKIQEKFIYINNGIDVKNIKMINKNHDNKLTFLTVAHVAFWHGYDRIIKGLHEYYKTYPEKEVFYHCVGEGVELTNLKKLTKELNLEKYVIFHGTKTGEDLDKVVDECDIALGSLGFHRSGLTGGSPLKAREYCARGIPFVIAYDDWDFPETFPFVYRIPKDDSPVDINQVIKWYENLIKEHPNYSIEMRKYAEENLSWDAKMKPVIEKIKELAKEKERKPTT